MAYKKYKPLRLKDYDYSQPGAYFITICTYKRFCYFGDIKKEKMVLTEKGIIAQNEILEIPKHYENVDVGEFVVMPNHVHMVIYMFDLFGVGPQRGKQSRDAYEQRCRASHDPCEKYQITGHCWLL